MTDYDDFADELDELNSLDLDEYEIIAYGRDMQQAAGFRDLLIDHDIPAILEPDDEGGFDAGGEGVPILVPADAADEARDILEELEQIEELDDPDLEDVDDEEDAADSMQPLDENASYLDDDSDPLGLDDEDESY